MRNPVTIRAETYQIVDRRNASSVPPTQRVAMMAIDNPQSIELKLKIARLTGIFVFPFSCSNDFRVTLTKFGRPVLRQPFLNL